MKPKLKPCIDCEKPSIIWKKERCRTCSARFDMATKPQSKPKRHKIRPVSKKKGGELALFVELYHSRGGRSEISGKPLLPPGHDMFHWQFAHVLPKGLYARFKLYSKNIVCCLPEEHVYSTEHEGDAKRNPQWEWFFILKEGLVQEYFKR